jgi:hypothetical protein
MLSAAVVIDAVSRQVASAYEMTQSKETPEIAALLAAVKLLKMTTGGGAGPATEADDVLLDKILARIEEVGI